MIFIYMFELNFVDKEICFRKKLYEFGNIIVNFT